MLRFDKGRLKPNNHKIRKCLVGELYAGMDFNSRNTYIRVIANEKQMKRKF